MFDAYNQWLFGAAENLTAFQAWTTTHSDDYTRFTDFQKGRDLQDAGRSVLPGAKIKRSIL